MRDVVRCRETLQREVVRSRHYILKFLARRGFVYRGGLRGRPAHYTGLRQLTGTTSPLAPEDRLVFGEYFALLEYKLSRREILDHHIAELALTPAYAPAVATLQCFRGLQVHGAMVLATELADWRRFASPRQLMADLGFVPREHSSGPRERRGSITKVCKAHCRHVLVQAAWAYRLHPKVGPPSCSDNGANPDRHPTRLASAATMDFVHDVLLTGEKIRVLTVIDRYTRECLALVPQPRFSGAEVGAVLHAVGEPRGGLAPVIQADQDTEFTSRALDQWAYWNHVTLADSRPGTPGDNAHCGGFNGTLRREFLSQHWFASLDEAHHHLETWRTEYINIRPHHSVANQPPALWATGGAYYPSRTRLSG